MLIFIYLLSCLTVINAGSHSLMAFATYAVGQTPFPEFSVVLMLDDVQIAYYDSNAFSVFYRSFTDSKYLEEQKRDADVIFRHLYDSMKNRALYLRQHLNHTNGVDVYQRLAGCELSNNKPGLLQSWDASNGQNVEEFTFDMEKNDIQIKMPWMITEDQPHRLHIKFLYENVYHPICIKTLRRYLNTEKNRVMRKVKPRVRLLKKTLKDTDEVQITCLATGFYPRHMNLTLSKGGQAVDDVQITGGELLPNGDGTYQMRKSLVISAEELHERPNYNCTAKHLSLDNKLDITFDVKVFNLGSYKLFIVVSVLVLIGVAILIIIAIIMWRKRHAEGRGVGTLHTYSPTPTLVNEHEK
ncbi:DLA class I histocompatibility antigen, A9/A9 alpha chain [Paramisgurnus dabryanus]|uniref:DLA class I histocompatibility antigen, A9/A9 alpha chain n=1 Tax=Paramisgurnus dabryanus TaxID=90735 RepID=UPI0031F415DD